MINQLWRRRGPVLLLMLGLTISLILSSLLAEASQPCQIEEKATLEELYQAGTGGIIYYHRFLRSDCYMVVFSLIPDPPPDAWHGYNSYLQVGVRVIGGLRSNYHGQGIFTLIRYQLAPDCAGAATLASDFIRQMTELGLHTPAPENFTSEQLCRGA